MTHLVVRLLRMESGRHQAFALCCIMYRARWCLLVIHQPIDRPSPSCMWCVDAWLSVARLSTRDSQSPAKGVIITVLILRTATGVSVVCCVKYVVALASPPFPLSHSALASEADTRRAFRSYTSMMEVLSFSLPSDARRKEFRRG